VKLTFLFCVITVKQVKIPDGRFAIVPTSLKIQYRKTLKGHFGKIHSVAWNPGDLTQLVSASQDGTLIIWNARRAFRRGLINLKSSWVMACRYSPSGSLIACGGLDNSLSIYHAENSDPDPKPIDILEYHHGYLTSVEFLSEREAISGSGDATCVLWDIESSRPKVAFAEHLSDVMCISLRDEKSFYSAGCDRSARLWDIRTPRCVQIFENAHEGDINSLKALRGGVAFGTGSDDSTCKLFDTRCGGQLNVFEDESKTFGGVSSIDFSHSGKILFAGYADCNTRVWDVVSAETIIPAFSYHKGQVSTVQVSPDGYALATGSWDGLINVSFHLSLALFSLSSLDLGLI
jgi:guanine nucleotide-binding protein G(I)/G(S)/G(T) subunit beta-1